jgi:hypothetical protein
MKDIVIYINEVSKGLVQRAYNKASGAQKNRFKKLYKEIYGDDVEKSDVSKINFNIDIDEYDNDSYLSMVKSIFSKWSQTAINSIKKVSINSDGMWGEYTVTIKIDNNEYYLEFEKEHDGYLYVTDTNVKGIKDNKRVGHSNEDRPYSDSIIILLANIYKNIYKNKK